MAIISDGDQIIAVKAAAWASMSLAGSTRVTEEIVALVGSGRCRA